MDYDAKVRVSLIVTLIVPVAIVVTFFVYVFFTPVDTAPAAFPSSPVLSATPTSAVVLPPSSYTLYLPVVSR